MSWPSPDGGHHRDRPLLIDPVRHAPRAIEIHGLRKSYGDLEVVRDISFAVAAGEVFCLLGPNGAGKTTTTEILEGYRCPQRRQVRVLGHDPGTRRARAARARRHRAAGIAASRPS